MPKNLGKQIELAPPSPPMYRCLHALELGRGVGTTSRYAHLLDDPLRATTERVGAIVTGNGGDKPAAEVIERNRR